MYNKIPIIIECNNIIRPDSMLLYNYTIYIKNFAFVWKMYFYKYINTFFSIIILLIMYYDYDSSLYTLNRTTISSTLFATNIIHLYSKKRQLVFLFFYYPTIYVYIVSSNKKYKYWDYR